MLRIFLLMIRGSGSSQPGPEGGPGADGPPWTTRPEGGLWPSGPSRQSRPAGGEGEAVQPFRPAELLLHQTGEFSAGAERRSGLWRVSTFRCQHQAGNGPHPVCASLTDTFFPTWTSS